MDWTKNRLAQSCMDIVSKVWFSAYALTVEHPTILTLALARPTQWRQFRRSNGFVPRFSLSPLLPEYFTPLFPWNPFFPRSNRRFSGKSWVPHSLFSFPLTLAGKKKRYMVTHRKGFSLRTPVVLCSLKKWRSTRM